MLCYIDIDSKIQFVNYLKNDQYQIIDKENWKQIDIFSSDDYDKYIESSYVLYESLDKLVNCLMAESKNKIQLSIEYV